MDGIPERGPPASLKAGRKRERGWWRVSASRVLVNQSIARANEQIRTNADKRILMRHLCCRLECLMLIDIDKIAVGDRIRKDFGDIQELANDIKENGLINPPVVNKSYELLAGERRLRACRMLGWPQIEVRMMDTRDAEHELNIEISENDVRKGFTKSERLDYIRRLLRIEQAKAKDNMAAGGEGREISHTLRSDEATAEQFGISSNTMRRELFIDENKDLLDPADFADWDEGRLSTNKAYQRIKAAKDQAERNMLRAQSERDSARSNLEEAYRANAAMEQQVAFLKRQVAEKPKPEVVERIVAEEVVPKDYESNKRRIKELEQGNRRYSEENRSLRRQIETTRKELERANGMLGMGDGANEVRRDVQYLISATNQYVRQYGGLTWTVQQLEQVDEPTLDEFRKSAKNLATFATALVASLEDMNGR